MGCDQTEQAQVGEVGVRPALEVSSVGVAATFAPFPEDRAEALPDETVQSFEHVMVAVLEVGEPAAKRLVEGCDDRFQGFPYRAFRLLADRGLELLKALLADLMSGAVEVVSQEVKAGDARVDDAGFRGVQRQAVVGDPGLDDLQCL